MNRKALSEADIRAKFITVAMVGSGWNEVNQLQPPVNVQELDIAWLYVAESVELRQTLEGLDLQVTRAQQLLDSTRSLRGLLIDALATGPARIEAKSLSQDADEESKGRMPTRRRETDPGAPAFAVRRREPAGLHKSYLTGLDAENGQRRPSRPPATTKLRPRTLRRKMIGFQSSSSGAMQASGTGRRHEA